MGLFDAFGVGGGDLSVEMQFAQAQTGGGVQGTVVFQAGRRAQQITNVTVKVTCTMQEKGPNGVQQQTKDVVGPLQLAGAFTTQPGQRYAMPFQAMLPGGLFETTPNAVSYRVVANADIDGEIDPGAGMDLYVSGSAYAGPGMAPMGGAQYQGGYSPAGDAYGKGDPYAAKGQYQKSGGSGDKLQKVGDPYGKGSDPYAKGGSDPYAAKGTGGGYAPGQHCLAQWTDGQYYGVTVVQSTNGMYLVQWDDGTPASWVRGDQIGPG